tara:strand:+ start:413 stop:1720 length:1308 start_codon:yes stop_codon:yes gene_type:complete
MLDIQNLYNLFLDCNQQVCIDTRLKEVKNSFFICIKGDNFDGNNFVEEAINKGAKYIITNSKKKIESEKIIYVDDTLEVLQYLAKKHRQSKSIPVIAITGTNGKTTTKDIVSHIMKGDLNVCKTEGNYNNHIGVPLTLLKIKKKDDVAIVELGANKIGDIEFLCSISEPTHGVITNIGTAHLSGFGSIKNILKTKSELYHYLKNNNGTIFIDSNNSELMNLFMGYKKTYKYETINPDDETNYHPTLKFSCDPKINLNWEGQKIKTKLIGNYNINNLICAIEIAKQIGIKKTTISKQLKSLELNNNRSQIINTKFNKIILDAYNANPTSLKYAINNFIKNSFTKKEKAIIIGDMLELGCASQKYHQNIVNILEDTNFAKYILIGENFQKTRCSKKFIKFQDTRFCEDFLKKNKITNSQILIKGSRKMVLEKLIPLL